jgi:hypothetical protein
MQLLLSWMLGGVVVRSKPPILSRNATSALLVGIALLATCGLAVPVQAGYYEVTLQSGGGEAVYTPRGGSAQSTTLTQPSYSKFGINGTLSYTYTEEYDYTWHPSYTGEPPVDDTFLLDGQGLIDFDGTSAAVMMSGTGSATISMGSYSAEASASAGPDGHGGATFSETRVGTQQLDPGFRLTGTSGSFTVDYAGSVSTSSPAVVGHFSMSNPNTGSKYIKINVATEGENMFNGVSTLNVTGWWSQPAGYPSDVSKYRVNTEIKTNPGQQLQSSTSTGPPLSSAGTWSKSWTDTLGSFYGISCRAHLRHQDASGN